MNKKRKPRIHLEDLDIDPEIIKDKKFEKIGDKIITSKNKVITTEEKKEIRALRNRISAQKSRDRKKAEFISLTKQIKTLQEQLEKKIMIIENYERLSCSNCKSKIDEVNKKFLDDNSLSLDHVEEEKEDLEKDEGLVLEEDNPIKKNSIFGKAAGTIIGFMCFIGIIICIFEGRLVFNGNNFNDIKQQPQMPLRSLTEIEEENNTQGYLDIQNKTNNVPSTIDLIQDNYLNNLIHIYHDKFILDTYSFLKKQKEKNKGFLMKKQNDDNSVCFETNNIENNNYIFKYNYSNNLPIQKNNIVLNEHLSNKIISVFVKDYAFFKKYVNGRPMSLEEQIELEAKNSEDGCVYLQMIIPKDDSDIGNKENNYSTYNNENNIFEIRCKIFAYNNYYHKEVAFTE